MHDLQKSLEADARLVDEFWPEQPTPADVQRVAEALKQLMADHEYTAAQVGKWIGYSATTIRLFVRGAYHGDAMTVAGKAVGLINGVRRKDRRTGNHVFIETAVARKIFTLVTQTEAFCDSEGRIGLLIGDGGHGKSYCLQEYAKGSRNAAFVMLDATMSSKMIFGAIASAIKVDPSGSLAAVSDRLGKSLRERHVIVLLDEASSLSVKHLDQLRQVVVVRGGCPLILAGNGDLLRTVNQSSERQGYESLDQFRSRLMATCNLDELASDDGGGLYTVEDVRRLYDFGGLRLTADAVNTLRSFCRTPKSGRLRTCTHIIAALHTAQEIAAAGYIDRAAILSAITALQLPVSHWLPVALASGARADRVTAARVG